MSNKFVSTDDHFIWLLIVTSTKGIGSFIDHVLSTLDELDINKL